MAIKSQYIPATVNDGTTILTIAAGQTVSTILDCRATAPGAFLLPSNWTSANLTYQLSADGETFYNLTDTNGTTLSTATVANQWLPLDPIIFHCARFIRLTSSAAQINAVTLQTVLAPYHQGIHA